MARSTSTRIALDVRVGTCAGRGRAQKLEVAREQRVAYKARLFCVALPTHPE